MPVPAPHSAWLKCMIITLFVCGLLFCVWSGRSVVWALLLGLGLFAGHALWLGRSPREVGAAVRAGLTRVSGVVLVLALIGLLTASWRASGTVACVIVHALGWVDPAMYLLGVFLGCLVLATLLGTPAGTSGTLGLIFVLLARTAGLNELFAAGAVMSGIFAGSRWSPLAVSSIVISTAAGVNLYAFCRQMVRTGLLPVALTCAAYLALSRFEPVRGIDLTSVDRLRACFQLNVWTLLPALAVLGLCLCRVRVQLAFACSIGAACVLALWQQRLPAGELAACLLFGYTPAAGAESLRGGGLLSMLQVMAIVAISTCYGGLFALTGLLDGLDRGLARLRARLGAYRAVVLLMVPLGAVSCNQVMMILLGTRLCAPLYQQDRLNLATQLGSTTPLVAALIPWCVACSVPCANMGVDYACLKYAWFLYLVPLIGCLYPPLMSAPHAPASKQTASV